MKSFNRLKSNIISCSNSNYGNIKHIIKYLIDYKYFYQDLS